MISRKFAPYCMYPNIEFPKPRGDVSLREMADHDLDPVTGIEAVSSPAPWNRNLFAGCLKSTYICIVAVADEQVVGFGIASGKAGEGHIVNIGVNPVYRRYGCGRQLLEGLLRELKGMQVETVFLEVRASNQNAMRLYRRTGFNQIGLRKDYYSLGDSRENAVVMRRDF